MPVVAGPMVRIEPAQAAGIPSRFTPLYELIAPAGSFRIAVTTIVSAYERDRPAMGVIRAHNVTGNNLDQVQFYGTKQVTLVLSSVAPGDLVVVAAQPYNYPGQWDWARVWVHAAVATLIEFDGVVKTAPSFAPPLPPTQYGSYSLGTQTVINYVIGESWGTDATGTAWRFRPAGGDVWEVLLGQSASGSQVLPFDLAWGGPWEVQAAQTSAGGQSAWGETSVWGEGGEAPSTFGFGITPFGSDFGN